jgi:hypothetical protein
VQVFSSWPRDADTSSEDGLNSDEEFDSEEEVNVYVDLNAE